jgi:hypothetical protein
VEERPYCSYLTTQFQLQKLYSVKWCAKTLWTTTGQQIIPWQNPKFHGHTVLHTADIQRTVYRHRLHRRPTRKHHNTVRHFTWCYKCWVTEIPLQDSIDCDERAEYSYIFYCSTQHPLRDLSQSVLTQLLYVHYWRFRSIRAATQKTGQIMLVIKLAKWTVRCYGIRDGQIRMLVKIIKINKLITHLYAVLDTENSFCTSWKNYKILLIPFLQRSLQFSIHPRFEYVASFSLSILPWALRLLHRKTPLKMQEWYTTIRNEVAVELHVLIHIYFLLLTF